MSNNILPLHAQQRLQAKFGNSMSEPNALVYFSRVCSCVPANQMRPDPKCKVCTYGQVYDKVPEQILMTQTSMKLDRSVNDKMYNFYMGGARITIYKYDKALNPYKAYKSLSQYDIIVVPTDIRSNISANIYKVKDSLLNFNVTEVESVSSIENDTDTIYREGTDYTVELTDAISRIVWIDGGNHPKEHYTVRYLSSVNFLVWEDNPKKRGAADGEDPRVVYCTLRPYYDPNKSPYLDIKTDPPKVNIYG